MSDTTTDATDGQAADQDPADSTSATSADGWNEPAPDSETHTIEIEGDEVGLYDLQRHRGGDETAILLLSLADGYQALAIDVDAGGQVLEIEEIGDARDDGQAAGMIEYWRKQNPKGILGGDPDDAGLLSRLAGGFGGGG